MDTNTSPASFESTIQIKQDGRDFEHPYLLVRCAVPHENGRTYSVSFLCEPTSYTHAITGAELKIWGVQLKGASFKDSASRRRFVSPNHKKLRHELSFIPSQLVRVYLEKHGYLADLTEEVAS